MTLWVNRVAYAGPRNGTTGHTVDPSSATDSVGGTPFSPTAGRLLVATAYGGVTSTTPSGWTLPTNGSAINNGGLYVWYRTAAGADTFSTTHNASNYICYFEVFEFSAGSTLNSSATATSVALTGAAGPTVSPGAGTWLYLGLVGVNNATSSNAQSFVWAAGTEITDHGTGPGGAPSTDGVAYSSVYVENSVATSMSIQANNTGGSSTTEERLMVAINPSAVTTPGILIQFAKVI